MLSKMIIILGELILIYLICMIFANIFGYIFFLRMHRTSRNASVGTDASVFTLIYNAVNNLTAFILIISAGFLSVLAARSSKSKGVVRTITTTAIFIAIMTFSISIITVVYFIIPAHHVISNYGITIIDVGGIESIAYMFMVAAILFLTACRIVDKNIDI